MKLRCINIPTPNTGRFAEFYHKIFGAIIDVSHGGPKHIEVKLGDINSFCIVACEDNAYTKPATNACQGFEFSVDDIDAEYRRLRELNIEIKEMPKDLPWGYSYFHIKDPDGNGIDIIQKL